MRNPTSILYLITLMWIGLFVHAFGQTAPTNSPPSLPPMPPPPQTVENTATNSDVTATWSQFEIVALPEPTKVRVSFWVYSNLNSNIITEGSFVTTRDAAFVKWEISEE